MRPLESIVPAMLALGVAACSAAESPSQTEAPSASSVQQPAPRPSVDVGSVAPAFELQGSDGKVHKLSDHAGREAVVIAWYPQAFTGG